MAKKQKQPTGKQKQFCREYIIDFNGTRAYKEVYKCSVKVAEAAASRLLRNVKVQEYVKQLQIELQKKTGITAEKVINEYAKVGFANIKAFLKDGNEITDVSQLPDDIAAAVESIQCDTRYDKGDSEGYTEKVKIKLHSKLNALDSIGRQLGIFAADNKQAGEAAASILAPLVTRAKLESDTITS